MTDRDETMVGTEWCLSICPYRAGCNCRWFDNGSDCYADNNRKCWKD